MFNYRIKLQNLKILLPDVVVLSYQIFYSSTYSTNNICSFWIHVYATTTV